MKLILEVPDDIDIKQYITEYAYKNADSIILCNEEDTVIAVHDRTMKFDLREELENVDLSFLEN